MKPTRIGHLSDIHVPAPGAMSLRDLFSKRLTGWLNFKLRRQKEYKIEVLDHAIQRLIDAQVDLVIVSGDLSNLSFRQEYERAKRHLSALSDAGIPWLVIPGNHDRYLATSDDGALEEIFAEHLGEPLREGCDYPWFHALEGASIVGLNSALPTPPFQAWGRVGEAQLDAVRASAARIRERGFPVVLVVHHHVGRAPNKKKDHERNLKDSDAVLALAHELQASLLIHGHNHWLDVRDIQGLRAFAASSGISSQAGVHRSAGQVAIHRFDAEGQVHHDVAFWQGDAFSAWMPIDPSTPIPSPQALHADRTEAIPPL